MFKIIGADQKEYGPISVAQIRQWITDGRLNAQTQAQREGSGDWQPLSTFDEFADIFNPGASTSSPAYASAPMAAPASAPMNPASLDIALRAIKGPANRLDRHRIHWNRVLFIQRIIRPRIRRSDGSPANAGQHAPGIASLF